ncbi:unnamed protein product [Adineta steineri]|uniref:MI domain-containing protein n=1 Tax=Adineta steineri TaxID=433720 RepID=A0A815BNX0_9BILA|nr:unnamed protein product [Adineta steineri]CAF1272159.1 unnamed protein product [Adineta steineri]
MQTMNIDQLPYYPVPTGPHPPPNGYYQLNGFEETHRMYQPFYNQTLVPPPQLMNPFLAIVRPPNEISTGIPNYMPPTSHLSYGNNNLQQQPTAYPRQYYHPPYHMPQNIPQQIQPSLNQQYGTSSQSPQLQEKRKRQPLKIVDPASLKAPELETKKTENQSSNGIENETCKESTQQSQPDYSGVSSQSITDDKPVLPTTQEDQIKSQNQLEVLNTNSETISDNEVQPASILPATESLDDITTTPSNDTESKSINSEKTESKSQRYTYSIKELLAKRLAPSAQIRPVDLRYIPGITSEPEKSKPKPVDTNIKFLREIRSILNKLTPQTYDKLLQKLDELELDRYERLQGMIDIFFFKAVEEPKFCFMYANLCEHFKKKQITVPDQDGQTVTHSFRKILLSRCQTKFETDYRQDIDYDRRKTEVDAITDEKRQKEAAEDLEEALFKAKQRNFGNILFIGELFKLGILTETIMFECMDYLLEDKTDEENIECLCKLLRAIGKELDTTFTNKKSPNRKNLDKNYNELENIVKLKQVSTRTGFMIQDLMDLRTANWVARIAEARPMKIDDIHEQERIKREQQEHDQERDRQQRRDQHRNNPQQYTGSHGSRGSGIKQQTNRMNEEQHVSRFNINSVRQYQTNDKRNPTTTLNLAPQFTWSRSSTIEKKSENNRTGEPPSDSYQQNNKSKTATYPGTPGYMTQRYPSRELARENPVELLRRTANGSKEVLNSNDSSRNVSREQSRESSLNKESATSASTTNNSFDEEKTTARVHSLIEEYTENYTDNNNRSVLEAVEDLSDFCTSNTNQQAIIVRELFTKVLEGKPHARKAIGYLLDMTFEKKLISDQGFLSGLKMLIGAVPDYIVDIPLVWQYTGEILGAFIGGSSSNMLLLKSILPLIPDEVSKQLFQYIIRYAVKFSSKSHVQTNWQSVNFSLNDLFESNSLDSSFVNEYNWLESDI